MFRPKPSYPRWKSYDRFHLRQAFARMYRRPFTVNWLTNYNISRVLRSTNRRWRKVRR